MKIHFQSLLAGLALVAWLGTGCAAPGSQHAAADEDGPSGAKLWAQNCSRCHNSRSPSDYSNAQWDVAMLHMRIRANLTADEHRKILDFLQAGN